MFHVKHGKEIEGTCSPLNISMENIINSAIKIGYKKKLFPKNDENGNNLYQPQPIDAVWNVYLSDRSNGKTTDWVIIGLICYWNFKKLPHIVRSRSKMISEANVKDLIKVILDMGYITKITDGAYNSILYKKNHRAFYLCNVDDTGVLLDCDNNMCLKVVSVEQAEFLKSGYNAPNGDIVIYDEFINSYNMPNEFISFCDLLSTIFRKRMNCYIIMLANTINRQSFFFDELECRDWINNAEQGDKKTYCNNGTYVHVEILGVRLTEQRKKYNNRYFGFKNSRLNSITGAGWSMTNAQHLTFTPKEIILKNVFVLFQGSFYKLEVIKTPHNNIAVFCHKSNEPSKNDAYIYTCEGEYIDPHYIYRRGNTPFDKYIWETLWKLNRWYYASNSEASAINAYITRCNSETGGGYNG